MDKSENRELEVGAKDGDHAHVGDGAPSSSQERKGVVELDYNHVVAGTIRFPGRNAPPIVVDAELILKKVKSPAAARQAKKRDLDGVKGLLSVTVTIPKHQAAELRAIAAQMRQKFLSDTAPK